MLALGQARRGARRRDGFIYNFRVGQLLDDLLRRQHLAAGGALLTRRQARLGAGRGLGLQVHDLEVVHAELHIVAPGPFDDPGGAIRRDPRRAVAVEAAARKGVRADFGDAGGHGELRQVRKAAEGIIADAGDALVDGDGGDVPGMGAPRRGRVGGVVRHRAFAADGQRAVLQGPGHAVAAVAGEGLVVLRLVGNIRDVQLLRVEQARRALAGYVVDGDAVPALKAIDGLIAASGLPGGVALHEQQVGIAHRAGIAVGDVHQEAHTAQRDDVPHVVAPGGVFAGVHHAAGADGGGAAPEGAHVAQVLEGLGVALADHLGALVVVEHPHQLPGIAVGGIVGRGVIVVAHRVADGLLVGGQLRQVALGGVAVDDGLRSGRGSLHGLGDGGVEVAGPSHAGGGIILGHREFVDEEAVLKGDEFFVFIVIFANEKSLSFRVPSVAPGSRQRTHSLVIPVHLVGAIRHQRVQHLAEVNVYLFAQGIDGGSGDAVALHQGIHAQVLGGVVHVVIDILHGNPERRAGQLAPGDLHDLRLQRLVQAALRVGQPLRQPGIGPGLRIAVGLEVHGLVDVALDGVLRGEPAGGTDPLPAARHGQDGLLRPGKGRRQQQADQRRQYGQAHKAARRVAGAIHDTPP